jgi:hypothetical protein
MGKDVESENYLKMLCKMIQFLLQFKKNYETENMSVSVLNKALSWSQNLVFLSP